MPFTVDTALVRYAFADSPTPLHEPPTLGHLVRVDLARERISAQLAFPENLTGHHAHGLAPVPPPRPGKPLSRDFALALPPAPADAVEAWLTGVLAPLADTIRTGTFWAGPINPHADQPLQRLVDGFTPQATAALAELAHAQSAAWEQGLATTVGVPQPWRAYTWCHARLHQGDEGQHGLLGGFTVDGARYLRDLGGSIRQWWPGTAAELAHLLVETTPQWAHRPHRAHRNRGLAVLVWDQGDLMLEVSDIRDGSAPPPNAVAQAVVEPNSAR
ncbi:hypothetical protein [Nocardiopsis metallicus]|uniref:Uncharacterized protein n=1 Tax=Nocardiopsis metallicus TaxID=179819 RepID=A0A840W3N0_9ACTN|nr:hypothetical protein [Nocardiopsis metallicus]MBB5491520.1 hypothetical protein [Nocardiopsis metallicus]